MKLRRSERTHEQLRADQSENMNLYQPDEFAFNADMSAIALPCRGGRFDRCIAVSYTHLTLPTIYSV